MNALEEQQLYRQQLRRAAEIRDAEILAMLVGLAREEITRAETAEGTAEGNAVTVENSIRRAGFLLDLCADFTSD